MSFYYAVPVVRPSAALFRPIAFRFDKKKKKFKNIQKLSKKTRVRLGLASVRSGRAERPRFGLDTGVLGRGAGRPRATMSARIAAGRDPSAWRFSPVDRSGRRCFFGPAPPSARALTAIFLCTRAVRSERFAGNFQKRSPCNT